MKSKKVIIQVTLLIAVVFLSYQIYDSIMEPVQFKNSIQEREDVIKHKLGDIKTLQIEYKKVNKVYTASFDSLIDFYKNGSMPMVLKKGTVPDTLSELQALEAGIITRDTTFILIKDTLFLHEEGFNIDIIGVMPFTKGQKQFEMQAGHVTRANFEIPVFEVRCEMIDYLADIKHQELLLNEINIMMEEDEFPGLILGSMDEPSTDGNW